MSLATISDRESHFQVFKDSTTDHYCDICYVGPEIQVGMRRAALQELDHCCMFLRMVKVFTEIPRPRPKSLLAFVRPPSVNINAPTRMNSTTTALWQHCTFGP